MKYSRWIGVLFCIVIIVCSYMTWIVVPSIQLEIGGMTSNGTHNYGRPGLLHIILSGLALVMFLLPLVWAQRLNLAFAALNIAWALRNYIVVGRCAGGECPEKTIWFYLLLLSSLVMLLMVLFSDVKISEKKNN
ncbi:MAG: hypothetical protein H7Y27_05670 [Gemmatimonadaceae bacterium]|nr:hypothetical protein [Chitinophagaceae bacterium]